jgi:MFS transporter, DHA1 family, tetracycline resistance protein
LGGLASLAGVIAPPFSAWTFAAGIAPDRGMHLPGLPFFEAAFLTACALVIAARAVRSSEPVTQPAKPLT